MVKGHNTEGSPLDFISREPNSRTPFDMVADVDPRLVEEVKAASAIRLTRPDNPDGSSADAHRTVSIRGSGFDDLGLESTRAVAWRLSSRLFGDAPNSALCLLRDQKQYDEETYDLMQYGVVEGVPTYVRAEERLLDITYDLAERALTNVANGKAPANFTECAQVEHDKCIIRLNKRGDSTHLSLSGYEFNPRDTERGHVRFERHPACIVIMAATAIEEAELAGDGGSVLRICHFGTLNRDAAAKSLLAAAGIVLPAPIETVALSDRGRLTNKGFSWYSDPNMQKTLRMMVRDVAASIQKNTP